MLEYFGVMIIKKLDKHEGFDRSDISKRGENAKELENQNITNKYINKVLEQKKIYLWYKPKFQFNLGEITSEQ